MSQIELNNNSIERKISFEFPFSFIDIKRISFPDLSINTGSKEIQNLILFFTLTRSKDEGRNTFPLHIGSRISLYSKNPVIDFEKFIVPEENKENTMSTANYINEVTIKVKRQDENISLPRILIDFNETRGIEYE